MAVEDGGVLGLLLGMASERLGGYLPAAPVCEILLVFEKLRKHRTTVNVQGAVHNRWFYHMPDGEEQRLRDQALLQTTGSLLLRNQARTNGFALNIRLIFWAMMCWERQWRSLRPGGSLSSPFHTLGLFEVFVLFLCFMCLATLE